MDLYNTKLDKSKISDEMAAYADKLAAEIEAGGAGGYDEQENDGDEGARFTDVLPEAGGDGGDGADDGFTDAGINRQQQGKKKTTTKKKNTALQEARARVAAKKKGGT